MKNFGRDDPAWVDVILDWKWTWLIARTTMVGVFVISGILMLLNFNQAIAEQEAVGPLPGHSILGADLRGTAEPGVANAASKTQMIPKCCYKYMFKKKNIDSISPSSDRLAEWAVRL
jgi:hypothetical protein